MLGLQQQFETADIKLLRLAAVEPGKFSAATLLLIKRSGIRIVRIASYEIDAQTVASLADLDGMTSAGWAWITLYEMVTVSSMAGWLWFRPPLVSYIQTFAEQVSTYSKAHFNLTVSPDMVDLAYSTALYDAIMRYAVAANTVMAKGGELRDAEAVTAAMQDTIFTGARGTPVLLDSNGDRIDSYEVMNYLSGADGPEYKGMTYSVSSTGFELQEYAGGYNFCSRYSSITPTV